MKTDYEMILCIVNRGFASTVMDAAVSQGATGGTVIPGRGTANPEAEQFFHISIEPEKELVMIVVPSALKDAVIKEIYARAGTGTDSKGIVFSLPVEDAVGLRKADEPEHGE